MTKNKPTILVIEPDTLQRNMIKLALSRIDCHVSIAMNVAEVLDKFQTEKPDIVLLDLFLPQMNGLDLITYLNEYDHALNTTIIAISALGFPEVVEQAKDAGAYDFIIKPINAEIIIQRVNKALNHRK